MNRRKLLSLCGTAGLALVAGCQAFGSTVRREPSRFEDVELSGPSEALVGDAVSLSVSVTNAGGQAGDFADALTVEGAADSDTEIRIEGVPADESRTVEVGPYALGYAGDHRFRLADAGRAHVVSVSAPTLRAGESFVVPDGPEVVVSDATAYGSLFYETRDGGDGRFSDEQSGRSPGGRAVHSPDEGSVLVVLRVSVTNRGGQVVRVGSASFDVAGGEMLAGLGDDRSLEAIAGVDGDPLPEAELPPGESESGWLLAEVPRERVRAGLRVAWNRTENESDGRADETTIRSNSAPTTTRSDPDATTTRDFPDATPEARWTFEPAEPPRFEVADLTIPDEVELGSSLTAAATVRNAGSAAGTYRGVLERRDADETDWERVETYERGLSPGASATVTADLRASAVGRAEYRLRPGSATASLTVRPAERALGEQFTTPDGAAIRVEVGTDAFDGLFTSYVYEDLNNQTVRAEPGHTFAFVRVAVENATDAPVAFPPGGAFSVVADGSAYSVFHSSSSEDLTFLTPVDGPWYAPPSVAEPGGTHAGWLVFQVPDDVTVADLAVRCSPGADVTATWSSES